MFKKAMKAVVIIIALEVVIILITGLASRWSSASQFSDAISLAGYGNMLLGLLSIIGNANNRFNGAYLSVAQRLGRNKVDLMKDEQESTFKSFRFLVIMFVAGLINILIGSLI